MKMWIARDASGRLNIYRAQPIKNSCYFNGFDKAGLRSTPIDPTQFPEVTFENSPQMIELVLIKNEKSQQ